MKKLFAVILLALLGSQAAYATDAAKIKLNISGAFNDNRYFLCMQDIGCLSLKAAAKKGKVYPLLHAFEMDNIYITNMLDYSLNPQGLPKSCNVVVSPNQTITIHGHMSVGHDNKVKINQLHCTISNS